MDQDWESTWVPDTDTKEASGKSSEDLERWTAFKIPPVTTGTPTLSKDELEISFNPKITSPSLADTKLTWCSTWYILFRSTKSKETSTVTLTVNSSSSSSPDSPNISAIRFLGRKQQHLSIWTTTVRCAFSAKSLMTVWRSPFCSVFFYLTSLFMQPMKVNILWLGFICFPFTIIPTVCNLERIYILLHLLLFIARFTVTAKQIFPFFLLSILFSFFLFFLLTIGYSIFLPFVRFLWSSITIWLFSIGQDPYLFCSCQQKGALLTEGTTVTLKLFFN